MSAADSIERALSARAGWRRQAGQDEPQNIDDLEGETVDVIVDVLHAAADEGLDADRLLDRARAHFDAERDEE